MNLEIPSRRRRSAISLTPLIDVVFILLLFFMLASNFSQERSLSITSQPTTSAAVVNSELTRARVRLVDVDLIRLDGVSYTLNNFLAVLNDRLESDSELLVSVSVSDKVDVQSLLDLIAEIKAIGISKISMDGSALP